jgi:hypothetical protein
MASIFWKIRKWFALRKSKKLEQEHVPTLEELKKDQEQFEKEGMEMKKLILKKPKISDRKLRSFPKTSVVRKRKVKKTIKLSKGNQEVSRTSVAKTSRKKPQTPTTKRKTPKRK